MVDSIAADKCRVAAGGSRLSLACQVKWVNYGWNSVIFNQSTDVTLPTTD